MNGEKRFADQRDCSFYVFDLKLQGYAKPGISLNVEKRADEVYGDLYLEKVYGTRAEAFLLEQAVLDATRGSASIPDLLAEWGGRSEVRQMHVHDLVAISERLISEMEELGMWEFAARYVPMTAAQRAICQQRALEVVAA